MEHFYDFAQILARACPILPNVLICYFLMFGSLVFSDTAYNDGWEWYIVTSTEKFTNKTFSGPNLGQKGPKITQK